MGGFIGRGCRRNRWRGQGGDWRRRRAGLGMTGGRNGADEGTRTLDLRFTKPLLFRLSYIGTGSIVPQRGDIANRRGRA